MLGFVQAVGARQTAVQLVAWPQLVHLLGSDSETTRVHIRSAFSRSYEHETATITRRDLLHKAQGRLQLGQTAAQPRVSSADALEQRRVLPR